MEGSIKIKKWHIYRSTLSEEEEEEVYAELPYEDIIRAVKNAFHRQAEADFVTNVASNLKRKYTTREIEDATEASQLNLMKAMRSSKSQKTNVDQEAGSSQRTREEKKASRSQETQTPGSEGQSSSSSRKAAVNRRRV